MNVTDYESYRQARRLFTPLRVAPLTANEFIVTCQEAVRVWTLAYLENPEDLDDVVQHLFLRLLESEVWLSRPKRAFRDTLWTALHNEFYNYCRGTARRSQRSHPGYVLEDPEYAIEQLLDAKNVLQEVPPRELQRVLHLLDECPRSLDLQKDLARFC
jgi:DNA-directed RNA polymerase specialized sigma24 family protein